MFFISLVFYFFSEIKSRSVKFFVIIILVGILRGVFLLISLVVKLSFGLMMLMFILLVSHLIIKVYILN